MSILVFTMTFAYAVGDNFSFLSFFKNNDRFMQDIAFDTGADVLRTVSELNLAETVTKLGRVSEALQNEVKKIAEESTAEKDLNKTKSKFSPESFCQCNGSS